MSTELQAPCGGRVPKRMDGKSQLRAIRYRLEAIRHNCLAGAALARHDKERSTTAAQRFECEASAVAYETCAEWLEVVVEAMPKGEDGE